MSPDATPSGVRVRRVRVSRVSDFAAAADLIAEIAQGEGFVVAGAYPQSDVAFEDAQSDGALPASMCIELDAPRLAAALLRERPDAALLLPWRVHLLQSEDGLVASALDPALLHEWIPQPSADLYKRLSWLEVALEIVLEALD